MLAGEGQKRNKYLNPQNLVMAEEDGVPWQERGTEEARDGKGSPRLPSLPATALDVIAYHLLGRPVDLICFGEADPAFRASVAHALRYSLSVDVKSQLSRAVPLMGEEVRKLQLANYTGNARAARYVALSGAYQLLGAPRLRCVEMGAEPVGLRLLRGSRSRCAVTALALHVNERAVYSDVVRTVAALRLSRLALTFRPDILARRWRSPYLVMPAAPLQGDTDADGQGEGGVVDAEDDGCACAPMRADFDALARACPTVTSFKLVCHCRANERVALPAFPALTDATLGGPLRPHHHHHQHHHQHQQQQQQQQYASVLLPSPDALRTISQLRSLCLMHSAHLPALAQQLAPAVSGIVSPARYLTAPELRQIARTCPRLARLSARVARGQATEAALLEIAAAARPTLTEVRIGFHFAEYEFGRLEASYEVQVGFFPSFVRAAGGLTRLYVMDVRLSRRDVEALLEAVGEHVRFIALPVFDQVQPADVRLLHFLHAVGARRPVMSSLLEIGVSRCSSSFRCSIWPSRDNLDAIRAALRQVQRRVPGVDVRNVTHALWAFRTSASSVLRTNDGGQVESDAEEDNYPQFP